MESISPTERRVLICHLVSQMRKADSWAGETQIQKSIVFLQELLNVPLGYEFIIYKHGPFSFDLRTELALMRARLQLDLEPHLRYGPSFILGTRGKLAIESPTAHDGAIMFVAKHISVKDTRSLERLSTAFFLQQKTPSLNDTQIAAEITRLKPHIRVDQARAAVEEITELRQQVKEMGLQ